MREEEKMNYFEQYNNRTHLYGKVGLSIGLLMMLAVPFLMGVVLKAMPDMKAFVTGFAQIAIVYIPSCVVEFMIYTPMLGAGGSYLAFITGNLLNMKIYPVSAQIIGQNPPGTGKIQIFIHSLRSQLWIK